MKNYLNEIVKFIGLLFFQVLIVNHLNLNFYVQPYIHLLFILTLPLQTSRFLLLVLAFITGGIIDIFSNSLGMHIFASVALAFFRPYIIYVVSSKAMLENLQKISLAQTGWIWYSSYLLLSSIIYLSAYFLVEHFSFSAMFGLIIKILGSTALSVFLMLLIVILFSSNKKRRTL